jgi:hypothetical protein
MYSVSLFPYVLAISLDKFYLCVNVSSLRSWLIILYLATDLMRRVLLICSPLNVCHSEPHIKAVWFPFTFDKNQQRL